MSEVDEGATFDAELLALFLFGTFFVAGLGAAFSPPISEVYNKIVRPRCSPPLKYSRYIFGIVWGLLYTLSAVAAFLVRIEGGAWKSGEGGNLAALVVYSVLQVFLTPYIVFGSRRQFVAASIVIFISLLLAFTTVVLFAPLCVTAAVFMAFLSAWITYALYLQVAIAALNWNAPEKDDDVLTTPQTRYAKIDSQPPSQNYSALRGAQIRR